MLSEDDYRYNRHPLGLTPRMRTPLTWLWPIYLLDLLTPRTPSQSIAKLIYSPFGRPKFRHPHRNFSTPTLRFLKHCPVQLHDTQNSSHQLSSFNHGKLSSLSPSPARSESCRKTQCSNCNSDKFRRPEELGDCSCDLNSSLRPQPTT